MIECRLELSYGLGLSAEDFPVTKFSYADSQKKISTFKVTIEQALLPADLSTLLYNSISVLENGVQIVSGIVSGIPIPALADGNQGYVTINADGEIGRLYVEESAQIHFQNTTISAALGLLLATTALSNWVVGDTSTLANNAITMDTRNRESLWAQIKALVEVNETPTYVRYGGFAGGNHQLDVGEFGAENEQTSVVGGYNLVGNTRYKRSSSDPIKVIRPISGKVGGIQVPLSRALNIFPGFAADPDYPLTAETVVNNTITTGRRMRKEFSVIKTQNNAAPTDAERDQAAVSLYYVSVRELIKANPKEQVSLEAAFSVLPIVNDKIHLDVIAHQMLYDVVTELSELVPIGELKGWYRITSLKADYKNFESLLDPVTGKVVRAQVIKLSVTDGDDADIYDGDELLLHQMTDNSIEDNDGAITGVSWATAVELTHSGVVADCTVAGPIAGKTFDFPMPTIPAGASSVEALVSYLSDTTALIQDIRQPVLPAITYRVCVTGSGGAGWTVGDNITVRATYIFR